jgi:hypothetical protein
MGYATQLIVEVAGGLALPAQADGASLPQLGTSATSVMQWVAIGLIGGGVVLIGAVLVGMRRGRARAAAGTAPPAQDAAMTATVQEAERLLRLMGEAEELCGRLGAELEDRARRVERLLAQADAALEGRRNGARGAPTAAAAAMPAPPAYQPPAALVRAPEPRVEAPCVDAPVVAPRAVEPVAPEPVRPSVRAETPRVETPRIVTRAVEVPPAVREPAPVPSGAAGLDTLAGQVYALADQGFSPVDIAQRLGQHTGKVELILALRE